MIVHKKRNETEICASLHYTVHVQYMYTQRDEYQSYSVRRLNEGYLLFTSAVCNLPD